MENSITVELDSANGPRVLVHGDFSAEEIEAALPEGWTIGENYGNGVLLASGAWSFPIRQDEDTDTEINDDKLKRAARYIDACSIGNDKWAHYDDSTSLWYVVSSAELAELCDYLDDDDPQINRDAYSHWCAGTAGREMPEGWTPDDDEID